jgi:hypothetical protein
MRRQQAKDMIIEGVRRLVVSAIDYSAFITDPWDQALTTWATSYLEAFSAHPNTIRLLATTPVRCEALIVQYGAAAGKLLRAGWPAAEILKVIIAMESFRSRIGTRRRRTRTDGRRGGAR